MASIFIYITLMWVTVFFQSFFLNFEANYFTISWWFSPYIHVNQPWVYMCSPSWTSLQPPSPSHSSESSQCASPDTLCHALNLDWWSISQMIIYRFQCYSLKSSHPRLLPQSPKDCSLHLCLFCCLAYRVIDTIFLNSIYMHEYTVLVFSFWLTSLCIMDSFHPPH